MRLVGLMFALTSIITVALVVDDKELEASPIALSLGIYFCTVGSVLAFQESRKK
jgi:hypothetical protein